MWPVKYMMAMTSVATAYEATPALIEAYDRPSQKTLLQFVEEKYDEALMKDFERKKILGKLPA